MISNLKYLLATFSQRDRVLLIVFAFLQFILATTDVLGVAAVLPLMQTLTGAPLDAGALGTLHGIIGGSRTAFTFALAGLMAFAFILNATLAAAAMWWSTGFVARLQARTSRRLLSHYLSETYLSHRTRDTGQIISAVGAAVQRAHVNVLGGILAVVSSSLSITLIVALLLMVTPLPSLAATAYFAAVVFILQRILAPANRHAGNEAQDTARTSTHALVDAIHGFRESTLHDAQGYFTERYDRANLRNALATRKSNYLLQLPKQVLQLVTMLGIVLLVVLVTATGNSSSALPTLSLFVAAIIKILPLMVTFTATLGMIRAGLRGLSVSVSALKDTDLDASTTSESSASAPPDSSIHVRGVSFRYPNSHRDVLKDISFSVPSGTSLAICGSSGSGKTTLIDIILGLLPPTSGKVTYGSFDTWKRDFNWHQLVAYVPQDVYITNDTIAANVAFGIPVDQHDRDLIIDSLRRAELADIIAEMEHGIDTMVGERGARLSGGQRQRVGVARALYRRPRILVLDEATSALDNETEYKITKTLNSLNGTITTIIVAHRLSTVRDVNSLAFLNGGRIQAVGTFGEVALVCPEFRRLVDLGRLELDFEFESS